MGNSCHRVRREHQREDVSMYCQPAEISSQSIREPYPLRPRGNAASGLAANSWSGNCRTTESIRESSPLSYGVRQTCERGVTTSLKRCGCGAVNQFGRKRRDASLIFVSFL